MTATNKDQIVAVESLPTPFDNTPLGAKQSNAACIRSHKLSGSAERVVKSEFCVRRAEKISADASSRVRRRNILV